MGKSTSFGTNVGVDDCPSFGFPSGNIAAACEEPTTGKGIACGGVALQRVDCLQYGFVKSGDYFRHVGGLGYYPPSHTASIVFGSDKGASRPLQFITDQKPCRPNDLYSHFEKQGYELDWGDTKWLEGHLKRGNSPAVCLVG